MNKRGTYQKWTDGEWEFIRANKDKMTVRQMAQSLGRNWDKVYGALQRLDKPTALGWRRGVTPCAACRKPVNRKPRKNQPRVYCSKQCQNDYHNGRGRVVRKARGDRRHLWSDEEKQFLRDNHCQISPSQMADALHRSIRAVYGWLHRLKLRHPKHYSAREDRFISENYPRGARWCAEKLGRTIHGVRVRARRLGIQPVNPVRNERHKKTMLNRHGVQSPGQLIRRRTQQARKASVIVQTKTLLKALEAACPS